MNAHLHSIDSCPRNADGVREVCCPVEGIVPSPATRPEIEPGPAGECGLQGGGPAECVLYSACTPFVQLLVNLQVEMPWLPS